MVPPRFSHLTNRTPVMNRQFHGITLLLLLVVSTIPTHAQEPARAEPIKLSGQFRLRSELDDRGLSVDETVFVHLLRTRLRATARPLSWISIVAEIQDTRFFGQSDAAMGRGTTDFSADGLDMHQAWGQIDSVFALPVNLRVGRQEIAFANERLIGAAGWNNSGRSFDGARATLNVSDLSVDAFGARLSAPNAGPTASQNLYGVWGSWKPSKTVAVDLFGLRDDNNAKIRRGEDSAKGMLARYTIGTLAKGTFGPIDVEIEGAAQTGNAAATDSTARREIHAFLGSGTVTATILEDSKTRLSVLGTLLSGDGSPADDRNETFNTLFGTNHRPYGTMDIVPDLTGSFGLVDLGAALSSSPVKGLKLLLEGHSFAPQRGGAGENFGIEIDLTAWWRVAGPFELSGGASIFSPGGLLKARLGEDPRLWAYIAGQWDF